MAEHVDDPSLSQETVTENTTEKAPETVADDIIEKSDDVDSSPPSVPAAVDRSLPSVSPAKPSRRRLFGREKPVHKVLGGGKAADVLLWRDKKISVAIISGATAIWVLFELINYHLLTLLSHCLLISLTILFLWSKASTFINKTPPRIPEVQITEDKAVKIALALRNDMNRVFAVLRDIALGRDLKKFLSVVAGLWVLSLIGSYCDFLTLFYIVLIMLHTVPVLYERYEDKVDEFGERAMGEIKKNYEVFNVKVLSKIPRGPAKAKKIQ